MPLWDGDEIKALHRIAEALEDLLELAREVFEPPAPHVRSVNLMAFPTGPVAPGDSGTFTAEAVDANGAQVPGAAISVVGSDDTLLALASDGAPGTATITYTAIAAGAVTVTGSTTNPDGSVVSTGTNNPGTITVEVPAPTVAAAVNIA